MQIHSRPLFNSDFQNSNRNNRLNMKNSSNNIAFGYGISIATREFKTAKDNLKKPEKIVRLDALRQLVLANRNYFRKIIDTVQEKTGAMKEAFSSVVLGFKAAKGGEPNILVSLQHEDENRLAVGDLFKSANSTELKDNAVEKIADAVRKKAEEGAFIAKEYEKIGRTFFAPFPPFSKKSV